MSDRQERLRTYRAKFEGVIPDGQYGGGDVIVWDWGVWQPSGTEDPARRDRPFVLPYLAGRPVNLPRYPDGVDHPASGRRRSSATRRSG